MKNGKYKEYYIKIRFMQSKIKMLKKFLSIYSGCVWWQNYG